MVIENLQGVQEQFIKSQEKKNEQIIVLRELVVEGYMQGAYDQRYACLNWEGSELKKELDKMFPPEVQDVKS